MAAAEPAVFLNIFLEHSDLLQDFLENMAALTTSEEKSVEVGKTLVDLYLREWLAKDKSKETAKKALDFLRNPASKYDNEAALVLCQIHDFDQGILFLYEKMHLHSQILSHHMRARDFAAVIGTCKQFGGGGAESEMWVEALWFLAKAEEAAAVDWVRECLTHLHSQALLPPLMVLEILSHSQAVTLGLVKDYLLGWLREENARIMEDEAAIAKHQAEIAELDATVFDLQNRPQTFQVSKCSACGSGLEVPAVHFLCHHSYHLSCFEGYADSEADCPMCLPANRLVRAQLSAQEQSSKETFSQLRSELSSSKDSMRTIAEHFGRGVFGAKAPPKAAGATLPRKESTNPFDDN